MESKNLGIKPVAIPHRDEILQYFSGTIQHTDSIDPDFNTNQSSLGKRSRKEKRSEQDTLSKKLKGNSEQSTVKGNDEGKENANVSEEI